MTLDSSVIVLAASVVLHPIINLAVKSLTGALSCETAKLPASVQPVVAAVEARAGEALVKERPVIDAMVHNDAIRTVVDAFLGGFTDAWLKALPPASGAPSAPVTLSVVQPAPAGSLPTLDVSQEVAVIG